MLTKMQRGDTAWNNSQVLPKGIVSVNTDDWSLRLHDGVTPGGWEVPSETQFNYGPGPKELIAGDFNQGFFGEVSASELFNEADLSTEVGLTAGTVMNTEPVWLKFASKGKILYVPKQPLRHSISWDSIYQAGLVYGVDGPGASPSPSGSPVNQIRALSLGGNFFTIRLLTGGDADPASVAGGEWNRLLYADHEDDPNNQGWGVNYTDADLGIGSGDGRTTWCQETDADDSGRRVNRGSSSVEYFYTSSFTGALSSFGWRPCLELVTETP